MDETFMCWEKTKTLDCKSLEERVEFPGQECNVHLIWPSTARPFSWMAALPFAKVFVILIGPADLLAPLPGVRSALPSARFACSATLTPSALPVMQSLRSVLSGNDRSNCTPFFPPIAPVQGYCVTKTKQSSVEHSLGIYPFSNLDFSIPSCPYIGLVSWGREPSMTHPPDNPE